jgi:hypothetical protein
MPKIYQHLGFIYSFTLMNTFPFYLDGKQPLIFAFLNGGQKEAFERYRALSNFKKFRIVGGNVVWGRNWDLIFPVDQLYKGRSDYKCRSGISRDT